VEELRNCPFEIFEQNAMEARLEGSQKQEITPKNCRVSRNYFMKTEPTGFYPDRTGAGQLNFHVSWNQSNGFSQWNFGGSL
jgi:hypothetical protein